MPFFRQRHPSPAQSFWIGAVQAFDLFGLFDDRIFYRSPSVLDPKATWRSDQEAMAKDWEAVLGDLEQAWKAVEPQLKFESKKVA